MGGGKAPLPAGVRLGGFGVPGYACQWGLPQSEALLALGSILNTWMLAVQTPWHPARHRSPSNDGTPPVTTAPHHWQPSPPPSQRACAGEGGNGGFAGVRSEAAGTPAPPPANNFHV